MSAPERIYLAEEEADRSLRIFEYKPARERKTDIPYRRETVCEWRHDNRAHYMTGCGRRVFVKQGDYCSHCGGAIRIVGQEETNT